MIRDRLRRLAALNTYQVMYPITAADVVEHVAAEYVNEGDSERVGDVCFWTVDLPSEVAAALVKALADVDHACVKML